MSITTQVGCAHPAPASASDPDSRRWSSLDNLTGREQAIGNESESAATAAAIPDAAWGPLDDNGSRYATASIQSIHPAFPHWASPVMVTVRNQNGMLTVVGIERPAEMRER